MGLLAEILFGFRGRNKNSYPGNRDEFIFYKIIDYDCLKNKYGIQCINTKAVFYSEMNDIIFDVDILHSLHPLQTCFIGIEYAKKFKNESSYFFSIEQKQKTHNYSKNRYGIYTICCQHRNGYIEFENRNTHKKYCMDPRDIALSKELIEEFDAQQAFHIGLFAGLKMSTTAEKDINQNIYTRPILKLVK